MATTKTRIGSKWFEIGETVWLDHAALSKIRPSDRNPRYITEERFAELRKAVADDPDHFKARPIIVLADELVALGGNMRLRAALANESGGYVFLTARDRAKADLLTIRDNVPYGEWEESGLAEMLFELRDLGDVDLALTGLEPADLEALLGSVSSPDDFDRVDPTSPKIDVEYTCPHCQKTFKTSEVSKRKRDAAA